MSFLIGDCRIDEVVDMDPFDLPFDTFFPDASLEALEPHRWWLDPMHVGFSARTLRLSVKSMLLRVAGLNILVDTCVGEHKNLHRDDWAQRTNTGFLTRLIETGVSPDKIDYVMCTHLHADHAGWNTQLVDGRWVPTFPNAKYLIGRKELAYWEAERQTKPLPTYDESVLPVVEAKLAELVDDGHTFADGLSLGLLPGHTPGCMGLYLDRGKSRAVFTGDAIHSPVQVVQPDWSSRLCTDGKQAAVTRRKLLEDSFEQNRLLLLAHQRGTTAMRLRRAYSDEGDGFVPELL